MSKVSVSFRLRLKFRFYLFMLFAWRTFIQRPTPSLENNMPIALPRLLHRTSFRPFLPFRLTRFQFPSLTTFSASILLQPACPAACYSASRARPSPLFYPNFFRSFCPKYQTTICHERILTELYREPFCLRLEA